MKKRLLHSILMFSLVACAGGATVPASAQDDPAAATQGSDPDKEKQKEEETEPGKGKLSEFGETLAKFWSVSTAFQAMQSFDDNIFLANNFRKSDTLTKLSGRVTVAYRGQHTRFEASYLPEFNLYQRYEPMNYSAHNYTHSFTHDFTRRLEMHWNVSAYQAPSRGNLPFKTINFGAFRYNMYSLEALNDGLTLLNGSNNIGVSYRWTPQLTVSANLEGVATYFTVRGNPAVTPVQNEVVYSAGARLGFDYALNARQTIGLTVGNTYFGSVRGPSAGGSNDHQHYQSVRATFSQRLPNRFTLHASVGPGITLRPGSPDPVVGVFFDVGVARQMPRYGYALSFQRSTQVGLLQDSITGYGVSGRGNRNFGRKWITNLGGSYLRSEGSSGLHQMESLSGNAQIAYRLTGKITPYINYGYTHQKALIPNPTTRNVDRNEIAIGFVYNFGVVAGR